jgi:hypothetical protein
MMRRSPRAAPVLALVVAAAAVRVWFWARAGAEYMPAVDQQEGYYEQGVNWLSRGVLSFGLTNSDPRLWRGPIYPAFLALCEAPFRDPWASHPRLALALLSALGAGFALWLGGRLGGRLAGWAAALLLAFDAEQIVSAATLNVHAFYGLALLGAAGAAALWAEDPSPARGLLLGAALGASLLVRSTHFLAVPLVLALAPPRRAVWPLVALVVVLLPWTARNALQLRVFQPLDAYSGAVNLYAASRGEAASSLVETAVSAADRQDPGLAAAFKADFSSAFPRLLALAERNIAADPWGYARGTARRWSLLFAPWLPTFAAALFACWRRKSRAAWAAFAVLASVNAYALVAVQDSYAECLRPLAALFWGLALAELAALFGRRQAPPPAETAAAAGFARVFAGVFAAAFAASLVLIAREAAVAGPLASRPTGTAPRAESLLRALARRDATGIGQFQYGIFLSMAERNAEACPQFSLAARRPRTRERARPFLIGCLLAAGRVDAAFAAAPAGDPSDVCRPMDRVDLGALPPSYYARCLRRFPRDARLLADGGVALWKAGRKSEALASLRAALAVDPASLPAALSLAVAAPGPASRAALARALSASREPAGSPARREAERLLSPGR